MKPTDGLGASVRLASSLALALAACGSPAGTDAAGPTDAGLDDGGGDSSSPVDAGAIDSAGAADSDADAAVSLETGDDVADSGLDATTDAGSVITRFYGGTNLSGAEFGADRVPGRVDADYTYPTHAEVDYFVGKGLRIFRIPFLWERLQPTLDAPLDAAELGRLKDIVDHALSKGAKVILDPHNYARYGGKVIGSGAAGAPTAAQFGAFWGMLAKAYPSDERVLLGLQNEPHDMATELWLDDANAAIDGIRKAGATNIILVPGNAYTGAHSWSSGGYGTPNATVMLGAKDPLSKIVYEVHQYLDSDSSGTSADCVSATIGSERLASLQKWLEANKARAFLGEVGTADNATCNAALEDMLSFIDSHRAQWLGWTWWSAGPWWGTYMYSLEPAGGADKPQLAVLQKHL